MAIEVQPRDSHGVVLILSLEPASLIHTEYFPTPIPYPEKRDKRGIK
jgi:hypothetical protein